jgi:hypothetical protein
MLGVVSSLQKIFVLFCAGCRHNVAVGDGVMPKNEKDAAALLSRENPEILLRQTPDKFGIGVPDRIGLKRGTGWTFVAELKFLKQLPVRSCKVGLKKKQAQWLQSWKDSGGYAFLVVCLPDRIAVFCDRFLEIFQDGVRREQFFCVPYESFGVELGKGR